MTVTRAQPQRPSRRRDGFLREMRRNYPYYLLILPAALVFFLVSYLPLPGIIIAFKDYNFQDGIFGSPFMTPWFSNFLFYFKSPYFLSTTFNTLWINGNYILWTTLINVVFAILLNELRGRIAKSTYQNLMFLPYFLSVIITARIVTTILLSTDYGLVNQMLRALGLSPVDWRNTADPWVSILVLTRIWKGTGYGVIIYLSSIAGIDSELYEAASLDGAGALKRILHITLPMLLPSIFTMLLLAIGGMFYGDFEMIYAMQTPDGAGVNGIILKNTDIIETYIFRAVRSNFEFGTAAAVGLYQSLVGFLLVFGSNAAVKLYDKDYALF